jgi:hypothetical protein
MRRATPDQEPFATRRQRTNLVFRSGSHAVSGFLGRTDSERLQEAALSRRGDDHCSTVLHPFDPTEIEAALRERRTYRARDVWPSFGPVEA